MVELLTADETCEQVSQVDNVWLGVTSRAATYQY